VFKKLNNILVDLEFDENLLNMSILYSQTIGTCVIGNGGKTGILNLSIKLIFYGNNFLTRENFFV